MSALETPKLTSVRFFSLESVITIKCNNKFLRSLYQIMFLCPQFTRPNLALYCLETISRYQQPTHWPSWLKKHGKNLSKSLGFRASHLNIQSKSSSAPNGYCLYLCLYPLPLLLSVSRYGWMEETDRRLKGRQGNRTVLKYTRFREKLFWGLKKWSTYTAAAGDGQREKFRVYSLTGLNWDTERAAHTHAMLRYGGR